MAGFKSPDPPLTKESIHRHTIAVPGLYQQALINHYRQQSDSYRFSMCRPAVVQLPEEPAAAVEHMDMIVMADSSLAHLAASMGKPMINLLHYRPYWLYVDDVRVKSWYLAMQSIRQQTLGESQGVYEKIKIEIFAEL